MAEAVRPIERTPSRLTVVVAAQNARASIEECLSALLPQVARGGTEVLVVDNSVDGTEPLVREKFPEVPVLGVPGRALVPELWGEGIRQSAGAIVALTTASCVPTAGWVDGVLAAHERGVAAVGGAIACDPGARALDWAVYFCRYSSYMPSCREGVATDLAGDNASYKRGALEACAGAWRDGFWEAAVHVELRRAGHELWLDPSLVVVYRNGFGVGEFIRQRLRHGRRFARDRSAGMPGWTRAQRVLLAAAVPPWMLTRIAQRVWASRQHRREFARAVPLLTVFLGAWALGEALGYLQGRPR